MKTLRGKRVLITGGARGLGLAMARRFASDGAEILLAGRDAGRLEQAWKELEARGARCSAHVVDVTQHASTLEARARIHQQGGPVDVLVNSAGVVFGGAFLDVPLEQHLRTHEVNVDGLVGVTHAFLPDLIAAEEGHLVNMASAAGLIGLPWGSSYAASKWAVIGFSESLRLELAQLGHHHVGVTTVCASYASTGMFAGVRPPRLTSLLSSEGLAEKVHRAVLRRRSFVREPWLVKLTPFLMGTFPRPVTDALSRLLGVTTGMKTWTGRGRRTRPD